jgi:hypothetical protein
MWGSDCPHGEGTYPHSRKVVRECCEGLSEADARAVVGGTAIELFGFRLLGFQLEDVRGLLK